ncbi:MAG: hypothetical protein HDT39_07345 [Lachnospiraceae bacterium]|nr:hypothetical protein [Lachnospiraceae bacterium]
MVGFPAKLEKLENETDDKKNKKAIEAEKKGDKTGKNQEHMKKVDTSVDDILSGKASIPTIPEGFEKWFDDLTVDELKKLLKNRKRRRKILRKFRAGNNHEWYKVSQAVKLKEWGVTFDEIRNRAVTAINKDDIDELWFVNIEVPEKDKKKNGVKTISGRHSAGRGSTHSQEENSASTLAHLELDRLFEESNSKEEYLIKLNKWADEHIELRPKEGEAVKGRKALPPCIRLP